MAEQQEIQRGGSGPGAGSRMDEISKALDARLRDATLGTICDGNLEAQFQERPAEALEVLASPLRLTAKNGVYSVTIPMEVTVSFVPADQAYEFAARAKQIKKPEPVQSVRPAYKRGMGLMVRPEEDQIDWTRPERSSKQHGTA